MEISIDSPCLKVITDPISTQSDNESPSRTSDSTVSDSYSEPFGVNSATNIMNEQYIHAPAFIQNSPISPRSMTSAELINVNASLTARITLLESDLASIKQNTVLYNQLEIISEKDSRYFELESTCSILEAKLYKYEEEIQNLTRELWSSSKRSEFDMSSISEITRDSEGSLFLKEPEITKLRKENKEALEKAAIYNEKELERLERVRIK